MLMGRNPFSPYLLAALGITQETAELYPLGRIRDVYTNDTADRVFILTRNYGEEYAYIDEALAKHPTFIQKTTATGDSTYTIYEFGVPEPTKALVEEVAENSDNTPAMDRYLQAIKDMSEDKENAQTAHMKEVGKQIIGQVMESFDTGENKTISNEFGTVKVITLGDKKNDGS
jgi:mevalonate kinase